MQLISNISELSNQIQAWRAQNLTIALVPTMGNLHAGHLSLVEIAKQQADKVVVSVFVNPLQFGAGEDFDSYPRTLQQDEQQLSAIGCDLLFAPAASQLYPTGEIATKIQAASGLSSLLEGATRPGHFNGVVTVVAKLFNLVQPNLAIFGQKDYQQWLVIQQLVADLNFPLELICAPISRAENGLALSSRNQYLSAEQLQIAPKLFVVLKNLELALRSGNQDFAQLEQAAIQQLLFEGFDQVDYVKICNAESLQPGLVTDQKLVILAVARLGNTRLLDNILLEL